MKEKNLRDYYEQVNKKVRKYFDDNNIEICFSLDENALKNGFENNVSIEDCANIVIKELLED